MLAGALVVVVGCVVPGNRGTEAFAAMSVVGSASCSIIVDDGLTAAATDSDLPRFARIQDAVNATLPGDVVCVRSRDHEGERVRVTRSGAESAPIRIRALGEVRTAGFVVEADHVVIDGFSVSNRGRGDEDGRGMGIYLAGTGLRVLNNRVTDTQADGIGCETYPASCVDTVIARNIVHGADGTGILVAGRRITVEGNDVSGSVRIEATDADGMRFFGSEITIRGNYVHDISDRGFPEGEEPHTDCFQTFDNDRPVTNAVVIENNICDNVDHQCLIAEGLIHKESAGIKFRNNVCRNNGSQGVLIRGFPSVEITNNLFSPSIEYFGVVLREGATSATVMNNTFVGQFQPYVVDETSRSGFRADYNLVYDFTQPVPPDWWGWNEPHGVSGEDPKFGGSEGGGDFSGYQPPAGSPVVDAGNSASNTAPFDLNGNPRLADGDGDGKVKIDIGPYEFVGR